nr:peptidoglycan recognition protein 3-like [Osmia lignaria]
MMGSSIFHFLILILTLQNTVSALQISWNNFENDTEIPRIVSREEWGARAPAFREEMKVSPTPYVVIHHGGIPCYCHTQNECSEIVRYYQNLHMDGRVWFDIGYSFLIGEDGNVYEGRGWNSSGAHAPGYNNQSIGICIIGDFSDSLPNAAALKALNALIEYGVTLGKINENYQVIGHRQVRNTECPGEELYKYVQTHPRWTSTPIPRFSYQSQPNIISRSEWGAKPPTGRVGNLGITPSYVIIHHSATDGCTTQAICQSRVRSFQNYHMNTNKWSDIGYNFVVGEDGNVYEGRGWGKIGSHAPNYNSKSIGICIIGNFVNRNPNSAAINAVQNLISYGVSMGKITSTYTLLGHRQTKQTTCPGDSLYNLIQTWPHWSSSP